MQQDLQNQYEETGQLPISSQQNRPRPMTRHTVTLGPLTHEGMGRAEISEQNEAGELHNVTLSVPAGLPGERVTIAVEAPAIPPKKRRHRRHWKPYPRR